MTENKESPKNSEEQTSKEVVEKETTKTKKIAPLWIRASAFVFSLITAGVIFYGISSEKDVQGKSCAEKEKQRQEFIILQDRVAQLERTVKIGNYIKNGGNPQLNKDLEIIFEKIGTIEEKLHVSASGAIGEIKNTVLSDGNLAKVDKLAHDFLSLKGSVENLFTEKEILKEKTAQINESIKSITEKQNTELKAFFAFEKLKNTVLSQSPYSNELDTLKSLFSGIEGIENNKWEILEQNKTTGIPNIKSLTQQLRKYIKMAITTADENSDWWDKTKVNMSKVVTVRKQGYVEGNDIDAILARAEYNLETNQTVVGLLSALGEINKLPPEKLDIFSGWINDANTIIDTQNVMDEIRREILLD